MLTVVMYHYVRPMPDSRGWRVAGRTLEQFEGQLDHLARHYVPVGLAEVLAAARGEAVLPPRAALLTFDDGLTDHARHVAPRLADRGWSGVFFATSRPAREGIVLDVHKIHALLSAVAGDARRLLPPLFEALRPHRAPLGLPDDAALLARYGGEAKRFDSPETVFVKRFLQRGLPPPVRREVVGALFARLVTADERAWSAELYASVPELRAMARAGMVIGAHGRDHEWLDGLDRAGQAAEIAASVAFLADVGGAPPRDWAIAYPYGGHDATTLELVRAAGGRLGFTVVPRLAGPGDDWLALPRLDTNDLPCVPDEPPAPWTRQAGIA